MEIKINKLLIIFSNIYLDMDKVFIVLEKLRIRFKSKRDLYDHSVFDGKVFFIAIFYRQHLTLELQNMFSSRSEICFIWRQTGNVSRF